MVKTRYGKTRYHVFKPTLGTLILSDVLSIRGAQL